MTENQKQLVVESNLKSQATLEILKPDFDKLENSKNKVSDLESIEKIRIAKAEVAIIDEEIKAAEVLFLESEKKEKNKRQMVGRVRWVKEKEPTLLARQKENREAREN